MLGAGLRAGGLLRWSVSWRSTSSLQSKRSEVRDCVVGDLGPSPEEGAEHLSLTRTLALAVVLGARDVVADATEAME
jgi:hypothetical protein